MLPNSFVITEQQKRSFSHDGFLLLQNAVPKQLLALWQEHTDQLESGHGLSEAQYNHTSWLGINGQRTLSRCNNMLEVFPDAVLDLIACPAVQAISRDLCGEDAVPLQCDALFKRKSRESIVLWHQDAPHIRTLPYINIGVYLDNADKDDGCLRYVPGSQHHIQDICALVQDHGWDIPGAVDIPAKAGDILIHDMMVLHGSRKKDKAGRRRTVYIEMRSARAIQEEGHHSQAWLDLRRRWMGIAVRRINTQQQSPGLMKGLPNDLGGDEEEIATIMSLHEPPVAAAYCYERITRDGYPE
ncbi:MAG: phytanoyl-CoA dioxygenase family protein [Bacteroidota bacterium]